MRPFRSFIFSTAFFTVCLSPLDAAPLDLSLGGTTSYDGWSNLTLPGGYSGVSFPGTGAWGTTGNWTTYNPGGGAVGAIGSNTANSSDALLYKVSNGDGGGPYPAGVSIYFGGFSGQANLNGGALGFVDTTPVTDLKTVAFQVEIGEAFGYDFYNHQLPVLTYTTASGTGTLTASHSDLISQIYSGSTQMPTGLEDIYKNTWGVQYDLSGVSEPILSYQVSFTGAQHAQLYGAQLDQSSTAYADILFPQATQWTGSAGGIWSAAGNWEGGAVPVAGKEVAFGTAGGATLDFSRSVGSLTINAAGDFALAGTSGAVLTVGEGGIIASSTAPANHTIGSSVALSAFSLVTVEAGNSLTVSGDLTAPGFYKKGGGNLHLSGNNTFSGNAYNQLIVMGGVNSFSGTNTNAGTAPLEVYVKNAVLNLKGGDNRLGANFGLNLYNRQFSNGVAITGEEIGKVVLGDASGKSDQTFNYIKAEGANIFNETTSLSTIGATSNAAIVGGSSAISTLTINTASNPLNDAPVFLGKLGGSGANENNLSIVKTGAGVQVIGGTSTYSGDTVIRGGMLRIDSATGLSANSNVKLDGGVLGFGGGNYAANLGTGAGEVTFVGDGGFAAYGGDLDDNSDVLPRVVTLNGGAGLTWGQGGFVGDGHKLILSNGAATNRLELANAIDFGNKTRTIQVDNGSSVVDARISGVISGSGGLLKTGAGALELTAANTYAGGTVVKGGELVLAGYEGSIKGNVSLEAGTALRLLNQSFDSDYYGDRIEDNATVTMKGATLEVNNISGGTGAISLETVGKVVLDGGANVIATARNNIINTPTPDQFILNLGSLERKQGATVHFAGAGLGIDGKNQIFIASAPVLDDGIVGAWATCGTGTSTLATEFLTYTSSGLSSFTGYTNYTAAANDSTWASSSNIKLNASSGAGFTTLLSGNKVINSLNMVGARSSTTGNVLNLGGNTLRVESGGIIGSGGASSRSNKINGGFLTAGTGVNTAAELIITATGATDIGAAIIDNGTGKVSLVKTGTNTLTLNGTNTYSGTTIVNQGVLKLGAAGSIANSSSIQVGKGSVLDVSSVTNFTVGSQQTLKGDGTITGNVTVNGALAAGMSPGTVTFSNALTLAAGSNFQWEIGSTLEGVAFDTVNVGTTLTIADLANFNILSSVADFSTAFWDQDQNFLVISAATLGGNYSQTQPFDLETNGAGAGYGTWGLTYGADGVRVQWTAVPEPSVSLVLGALATGHVLRRRRSTRTGA